MRSASRLIGLVLITAPLAVSAQTDPAADEVAQAFVRIDTDKNAAISKAEWLAAGRREPGFARIDSNADGKITLDELKVAAAARNRPGD